MDAREFLDNFEHISSATNGVQRLRELVLQLAVQGRLVDQDGANVSASALLEQIVVEKNRLTRDHGIKKAKSFEPIQDFEKPFAIPKNWEWVRFGEIARFEAGRTPSRKDPSFWSDGKYPWVSIADMVNGGHISTTKELISQKAFVDVFRTRISPKGTLLMSFKLSIGKLSLLDIDALHNEAIISIYPYLDSLKPYLFKCLNGFDILRGTSAAIKGRTLNRKSIENIVLAIPPINEQKRIVKKVEQIMTFCDQLEALQMQLTETRQKANRTALGELVNAITCSELERAWSRIDLGYKSLFCLRDCINDVKETVMDLAVQGKLSRQRTDEVAAHELLKNMREERKLHGGNRSQSKPMLTDVSAKYPVPSNWTTCRANELGLFITSGSRGWAKYYSSGGAWFIRIGNLSYQNTQIDPGNIQYVNPPEGSEGTRTRVEAGDILISITGDTGMVGIVPSDVQEAYINQHICLFRPSRLIDHEYLALMFRSRMGLRQLHKLQKGIKNSLSLQDVRDILINLPPRLEQTRIVTQTKRLLELCDQLKSRLSTLTLIHEKLSAGSVGFVLGMTKQVAETIRTEEKEKSFLKVPEVFLRLVAKMKKQLTETVLAKLLNQHGKSMEARELWQKSGLTIDEFYATLKREITEGFIAEPEVARLKFVEVVD
jgi:type I restriction enzyme S subunit